MITRIQEVIRDADKPSWLSSVPRNFGEAKAGTLKADEWRILCTVYLPLALISIWGHGFRPASAKDSGFLAEVLENTMLLVCAVSILCKRSTSLEKAIKYREYFAWW